MWRTQICHLAHQETGWPPKKKLASASKWSLSRFASGSLRDLNGQVIDNARPNFLLSHRESARIVRSVEQNWAKKKIPARAAIFGSPGKFPAGNEQTARNEFL